MPAQAGPGVITPVIATAGTPRRRTLAAAPGWGHLPTSANGQPAVAFHLWHEDAGAYLSWSITVLTLRGEHIAEITPFLGPDHFAPFGLPASLP